MATTFPIVMGPAGYIPQTPVALNAQLIATVAALNPGYTANLPGILIEDISSTDTYAMVQMDSSISEIISSITPYGANAYLLNQLGVNVYGIQPQQATATSVYVQFTGTAGYIISSGVVVSDGTYQYIVQTGTVIGAGGTSPLVNAIATVSGTWSVPANTVNQILTSIPIGVYLTVNNPSDGTPSIGAESETSFRSRTLTAGLAASTGMARLLKTYLANVTGVQSRLVSVRLTNTNPRQWEVICGGSGDQYQIANCIYRALFDLGNIVGSTLSVTGITNANPGVVATDLNHGYTTGQSVTIYGATGMSGINSTPFSVTVIDQMHFSIGINTTSSGSYTGGGYCTPNLRNVYVNVEDYPDTYVIPFVNPPQQTVTVSVLWNTNSPNQVNPGAMTAAMQPAIIDYINSIPAGQPINVFELNAVCQQATANILPNQYLTRLVFSVNINGIGVSPTAGTGIIAGDPESYFYIVAAGVTISQG